MRSASGLGWGAAGWIAWWVFRDRKRMVRFVARAHAALYPDDSGMVKSGPYAETWNQ